MKILVTSVGGNSVGAQIVKALKNSNLSYKVIGTDADHRAKLNIELDEFEPVPLASDRSYIQRIIDIHDKYKFEILLCGNERELNALSAAKELFLQKGIYMPIADTRVLSVCLNKMTTNEFLKQKNFHVPRSIILNASTDLDLIDWFPAIIKPYKGGSGSKGVNIMRNREECEAYLKYACLINSTRDFMLQEYIGHYSEEYTVGVLNCENGLQLAHIIMQRDLTNPINVKLELLNSTDKSYLGERLIVSTGISTGRFCVNEEISRECLRLCKELGATGPVNIQCRVHDGKVYIFEINPRFSGTTSSRSMVGFNEIEILLNNDLLQKPPISVTYDLAYINRVITEVKI